jgi:hypothetical protein
MTGGDVRQRLEPGWASKEDTQEEPTPPIPEGEALCRSCLHAPVCEVASAISRVAPEGGVEIGACGLYLPVGGDVPQGDGG